jgi:hypothetical protein
VRAALRRLIRKYYAKTRDGQGNVEEALRFINHASRILSDPERRQRYDEELALSTGTTEQRIEHVVSNAVRKLASRPMSGASRSRSTRSRRKSMDEELETGLDADEPEVERNPHHPGLTERVASFGRSPIVTVACARSSARSSLPPSSSSRRGYDPGRKQVLVWLTITLLGLTLIYGAVHGIAYLRRRAARRRRARAADRPCDPQLAAREERVPRHQPAAGGRELDLPAAHGGARAREVGPHERAAAVAAPAPRASSITPIWGLVLALLLSELRGLGVVPTELAFWLGHPLLAPILITASFVPIEALLIASIGTTPGKWLFGVFLQFSISDAYARRDTRAPARSRAAPLVPRVVGRHRLRLPAARARADRGRVREARAEPGDRLGLRAGRARHARPARRAQHRHRRVRPRRDVVALRRRVAPADGRIDCLGAHHDRGGDALGQHDHRRLRRWRGPDLRNDGVDAHDRADTDASSSAAAVSRSVDGAGSRSPSAPVRASAPISVFTPASAPPSSSSPPAVVDPSLPIDAELAASFADRKAKIAVVSAEGPRMLRAGNWRRAAELCKAWTELELANAESYRCLGTALQAQGYHQDAINAFRKAKQYDPNDRSLDASIDRSQKGIVAEFLNRYRR